MMKTHTHILTEVCLLYTSFVTKPRVTVWYLDERPSNFTVQLTKIKNRVNTGHSVPPLLKLSLIHI